MSLNLTQYVEIGECHEWTGTYGHGTTSQTPILKKRINGRSENLIVAREIWKSERGQIPAGRIIYRHCCNERCVRLEHLRCGKPGDQLRRRAALGMADHQPSTLAALTRAARRRKNTKYSAELAAEVRAMASRGIPDEAISSATGVGLAMVLDIRRGKAWRDTTPSASVFSWRPA